MISMMSGHTQTHLYITQINSTSCNFEIGNLKIKIGNFGEMNFESTALDFLDWEFCNFEIVKLKF